MEKNRFVFIKSKLTPATKSMDYKNVNVKNAHPYAQQSVFLKKFKNSNQWITGYNVGFGESEEAIIKDKKHPKHSLMLEKKMIEDVLKVSLEPDSDNEYLLNFKVTLADRGVEHIKLNLSNPVDMLKYRALIANGYVAPSIEESYNTDYRNCLYYFTEPEKQLSNKKNTLKLRNKISGKIAEHEDDKLWLLGIASMLGLNYHTTASADNIYILIDEYKKGLDTSLGLEKMVETLFTLKEDVINKFIINSGLKFMFIKYDNNQDYTIQNVPITKSKDELFVKLLSEDFIKEYAYLRESVYKKYNII